MAGWEDEIGLLAEVTQECAALAPPQVARVALPPHKAALDIDSPNLGETYAAEPFPGSEETLTQHW